MAKVEISKKNMQLAQKSMRRQYLAEFGQDSLSENTRSFTREELILRYAKKLWFWNKNIPNVVPGMNMFTVAKHAISTNAIEQL